MKKVFRLQDLDCANCAAKIENAVKKMDDVRDVNVNFMTQKLTLEAEDAKFDSVLQDVIQKMKKIEPDVCILN
ncbi:cation transporter [Treponema sp. OttesenSCG-928-L16]|nr:cation transporter [Treponema sp. OttesenSCG-928-L16]